MRRIPGRAGIEGNISEARNNVGWHSATLFIFADISFIAQSFSHTTIFCSILLNVYCEVDAGRSTGERRSLPFRRQVGQSLHQRACAPIFSSFQHFLFLDFPSNISIKVERCYCSQYMAFLDETILQPIGGFELTGPSWVNTQTLLLFVNADIQHFLS